MVYNHYIIILYYIILFYILRIIYIYIIRIAQFLSDFFLKRGILNWGLILKCSDEMDHLGVPTF